MNYELLYQMHWHECEIHLIIINLLPIMLGEKCFCKFVNYHNSYRMPEYFGDYT